MDSVKRAHRELVKKWHPDKYLDKVENEKANHKIAIINEAYSYLKKVKTFRRSTYRKSSHHHSYRVKTAYAPKSGSEARKRSGISSRSVGKQSSSSYAQTDYRDKSQQNSETNNQISFSWIDRYIYSFFHRRRLENLGKRRVKVTSKMRDKIKKEEAYWQKLREEYESRTRLGLYRSLFNALIFGRIISFRKSNPDVSLGRFSKEMKYEIDLRHSLIQDNIFYSVNKGWNLFLKFVFGSTFSLSLIYFVAHNYLWRSFPTLEAFVITEGIMLGLLFILLVPDNMFQRFLLWYYRDLEKSNIQNTFKMHRLPSKWEIRKQGLLVLKYLLLIGALYSFVQFYPII